MLRYKTETRPDLVALYDIRPWNGAGQFLQPRSPHGACETGNDHSVIMTTTESQIKKPKLAYLKKSLIQKIMQCTCKLRLIAAPKEKRVSVLHDFKIILVFNTVQKVAKKRLSVSGFIFVFARGF